VWEYNWIWKLDVMPRLKIFLWQLFYASLLTKGTLLKRGMNIDPLCPSCQSEIEDADHLFLHCHITREFWRLAIYHNWIDSTFLSSQQHNILQRLSSARTTTPVVKIDKVAALLWSM